MLLTTSLLILILVALLGITLFSYLFLNKNTPKALTLIHGSLAALSILLLLIYSILYLPIVLVIVSFLVLAAILGFTIFYRDLLSKYVPKALLISHGLIALTGICLLILIYIYV